MKNIKNFIYAYNKTSDAGPNTSSFSVFMNGCNLCCPYCMNGKLINGNSETDPSLIKRLKKDVDSYKPKMIFISGGEPTRNPMALYSAINLFRSWGCEIGMSTNGTNPEVVKKFLSDYKSIDYIAMDLKGNINAYKSLGNSENFMKVLSTWLILRQEKRARENFGYEIRTTLYPPLVTTSVLNGLTQLFHKDETWILQQFRVVSSMPYANAKRVKPYTEEKMKVILSSIQTTVPKAAIRYV